MKVIADNGYYANLGFVDAESFLFKYYKIIDSQKKKKKYYKIIAHC